MRKKQSEEEDPLVFIGLCFMAFLKDLSEEQNYISLAITDNNIVPACLSLSTF